MRARGFSPSTCRPSRAEQHGGRTIDDAGRIAGVVDVVDLLEFRIALHGHRIEAAHFAHHDEGRVERRQRLHVGVGPHVLVMVEHGQAVNVLHRHDRLVEIALLPGAGGALLALDGIGVDVVAAEAVFCGDQVGRDALRHEPAGKADRRVHVPGAAGRAHADAAHRFDAAGDDDVVRALGDLGGARLMASRPEAQKRDICMPGALLS
jgi:hypothetical protein